MNASATVDNLELHWKDYLHAVERVWYKANAHYGRNPSWPGWKGTYETARTKDPLLSYLRNARGAEEHTVANITARDPAGMTLQAGGTGPAVVRGVSVTAGMIVIDGSGSMQLDFKPETVRLLPVVNHGVTYDVPLAHMGNALQDSSVLEVARTGLKYYERFVDECDKKYGP